MSREQIVLYIIPILSGNRDPGYKRTDLGCSFMA